MAYRPPGIKRLFDSKHMALTGIALFTVAITAPFAIRDPDPHHDGIQYGAALGVSEGLNIQSEVFSQYGPVTAWIHGMTLWLVGPELIWIRLLHVFLVMGIAFAMYLILYRTLRLNSLAALAPIAWVASCPDWTVEQPYLQFWPWPSVLFDFFAVTSLLLWLKSRDKESLKQFQTLYASGVLVGLSGFTRSQSGLFLFFAMATALVVVDRIKIGALQRFLIFSLGTLSAGGAILAYLAFTNSLDDFVAQAIHGPLYEYGGKLFDFVYLWDSYVMLAFLFSLLAFFMYRAFSADRMMWMISYSMLSIGYLALILGAFTTLTSTQVNKILSHTSYQGDFDWSPIFVSSLAAVAVPIYFDFSSDSHE